MGGWLPKHLAQPKTPPRGAAAASFPLEQVDGFGSWHFAGAKDERAPYLRIPMDRRHHGNDTWQRLRHNCTATREQSSQATIEQQLD